MTIIKVLKGGDSKYIPWINWFAYERHTPRGVGIKQELASPGSVNLSWLNKVPDAKASRIQKICLIQGVPSIPGREKGTSLRIPDYALQLFRGFISGVSYSKEHCSFFQHGHVDQGFDGEFTSGICVWLFPSSFQASRKAHQPTNTFRLNSTYSIWDQKSPGKLCCQWEQ